MLFGCLIILLLLILLAAMWRAYQASGDPLHPIMYLAPLLIYALVYRPFLLARRGVLESLFEPEQLVWVQVVYLLGGAAFCAGALYHASQVRRLRFNAPVRPGAKGDLLPPHVRSRTVEIAWLLGGLAIAAYWSMIWRAGGLFSVYGQPKGGFYTASGYLGEMPLLSLAAIGLLYFAWSGEQFTLTRAIQLLVLASPLIVHGLLGTRRGPTFMVVAALMVGGYAVSHRRPKLLTVFVGTFMLGLSMLFLVNNRHRIFLDSTALESREAPDSSDSIYTGDDWIFSSGLILTSHESSTHFWGARLLTNIFIRPVPRQIWPGKYADVGFEWMETQQEMCGMADNQWVAAVGWIAPRGAAAGFIADLFLEFSYLGIFACFGFGWLYSFLWKRSIVQGGQWSVLYLFAAILAVYVPTQSVSAWTYRFLFLAIPTLILWQLFVRPMLAIRPSRVVPV